MLGTPYKIIAYLILVAEVALLAVAVGTVVRGVVLNIVNNAVEVIESANAILKN